MTPAFINFNGELYAEDAKLIAINNRAFKYGDGLFESMRFMNGELKFAALHALRLQKGMVALKMDDPSKMDAPFLVKKAEELAGRNQLTNGRVRLTVFRDSEGLYTPLENKTAWCMELKPLDESRYFLNTKGLAVDIFTEIPKPINALANIKTCNSLIYVMAAIFRAQSKLDEAILLNQSGFLCETTSANIFVYHQKQLYTPALSEGCVEGVMRKVIIDLARQNNIPLIETQLKPAILQEADEVFLTNASRGIQSVAGFGAKLYGNELSSFLVEELNRL